MSELIFTIVLVLAVITLVGHAIWVSIAWFLKILVGVRCPHCGRRNWSTHCSYCSGHPFTAQTASTPDPVNDYLAAQRLIRLALSRGQLTPEEAQRLEGLLRSAASAASTSMPGEMDVSPTAPPPEGKMPATAGLGQPPVLTGSADDTLITAQVIDEGVATESHTEPAVVPSQDALHALDREYAEPVPVEPVRQRISRSLVSAFMERANIRWIELLSAALIVVSSVGLVISLWSTLSATSRFFPSLVFMLATVAVHAAGHYTLRKWNLQTTSRGILQIGLTLIPLSVLLGLLLGQRGDGFGLGFDTLAAAVVGAGVYGGLIVLATRTLFRPQWGGLATLLGINCLALVAIEVLRHSQPPGTFAAFAITGPMLLSAVWVSSIVGRVVQRPMLKRRTARVVSTVAQAIFSTGVVVVFLLTRVTPWELAESWWVGLGGLVAVWAAVGMVAVSQLLRRSRAGGAHATISARLSYVALAFFIGLFAVCVSLLAATFMFGGAAWWSAVLLALLAGGIWVLHGTWCAEKTARWAGVAMIVVGVGICGEAFYPGATSEGLTDIARRLAAWLAMPRVVAILTAAIAAYVASLLVRRNVSLTTVEAGDRSSTSGSDRTHLMDALGRWADDVGIAALGALGVAGTLAVLASLWPHASPPWGGDWAALVVLVFAAGVLLESLRWNRSAANLSVARNLAIAGLILFVHGCVHLSQVGDLFAPWLGPWRPAASWTGGLAAAAAALSLLTLIGAWIFRQADLPRWSRPLRELRVLEITQAVVAIVGTVCLVKLLVTGDVKLAVVTAWSLPVAAVLWFALSRDRVWDLITSWLVVGYAGLAAVDYVRANDLWDGAPAGVVGALALLASTAAFWTWAGLRIGILRSYGGARAYNADWRPWGSVFVGIVATLVFVVLLSIDSTGLLIRSLYRSLVPAAADWQPLQWREVAALIGAAAALLLTTHVAGMRRHASMAQFAFQMAPLVIGLIAAQLAPVPLAAPAMGWAIAIWELFVAQPLRLLAAFVAVPRGEVEEKTTWNGWRVVLSGITGQWHPVVGWITLITLTSLIVASALGGELAPELTHWRGFGASGTFWPGILLLGPMLAVSLTNTLLYRLGDRDSAAGRVGRMFHLLAVLTSGAMGLLGMPQRSAGFWLLPIMTFSLYAAWAAIVSEALLGGIAAAARLPVAGQSQERRFVLQTASRILFFLSAILCFAIAAWPIVDSSTDLQRIVDWSAHWDVPLLIAITAIWAVWVIEDDQQRWLTPLRVVAIGVPLTAPLVCDYMVGTSPVIRIDDAVMHLRVVLFGWFAMIFVESAVRYIAMPLRTGRWPSASGASADWGKWLLVLSVALTVPLLNSEFDLRWLLAICALGAAAAGFASATSRQPWRGHVGLVLSLLAALYGYRLANPPANVQDSFLAAWFSWWGPIALGAYHLVFETVLDRSPVGRLGPGPRRHLEPQVELVACIGVAVGMLPITLIYGFFGSDILQRNWVWLVWATLAAVANLGLAIARVFRSSAQQRFLAIYVPLIALCAVVEVWIVGVWGAEPWHHLGYWILAILSGMVAMTGIVRECSTQYTILARRFSWWSRLAPLEAWHAAETRMLVLHLLAGVLTWGPAILLVCLVDDVLLRTIAACLPMVSAIAVLGLPTTSRRVPAQYIGLLLLSTTALLSAWAMLPFVPLDASTAQQWQLVQRLFVSAAVWGFAMHVFANFGTRQPAWQPRWLHVGWGILGLAIAIGALQLYGQQFGPWRLALAQASIGVRLATLAAWGLLVIRLLWFAVRSGPAERNASDAVRSMAVYGAEVCLVLLGIGVYHAFPELFSGWMRDWWPIVTLLIAYGSIALGELVRRTGDRIVSDPVLRSSLLLPLVPALGVWFRSTESETWRSWDQYALVLALGAGVYAVYSGLRKSRVTSLAAGIWGLAAFWAYLFSQESLHFDRHPQLWIVPPTIVAVMMVELNRNRLPPAALTLARYALLLVALLSSTAEVFFSAFAGQFWPPLVLLALSLLGAIAGILLRVRAFLYCGAFFTMVALVGMVWHAQQAIGQVWPWWAFGIAVGVAGTILLGYIEKNKPRMRQYLQQLRQWQ